MRIDILYTVAHHFDEDSAIVVDDTLLLERRSMLSSFIIGDAGTKAKSIVTSSGKHQDPIRTRKINIPLSHVLALAVWRGSRKPSDRYSLTSRNMK